MQGSYRKSIGLILGATALLAGCVTQSPQLVRYPEEHLLPGFSGYFSADVSGNRGLFAELLTTLEVESDAIVNRTNRITGGFDLGLFGPSDLVAIAYGAFPRGLTEFSLRRNRAFEESASPEVESAVFVQYTADPEREPLHVLVPGDDVLFLSSGAAAEQTLGRLNRGGGAGRTALRRTTYSQLIDVGGLDGPIATAVFEDPGSGLLGFLGVNAPGVPITDLTLSLFERDDQLTLQGALATRTARDAALFSRLSRFFVLLFVRSLGLDAERAREEVVITVEENVVGFSNIPVSSAELAGLVLRFGGGE